MIAFILKYWKFLAGALPVALVGLWLHGVLMDLEKASCARQIEQAKAEAVRGWEDAQKQTFEVSNDYQKQLADLRRRLNARRVQPPVCVPVTPADPGRRDAAAGTEHVRPDGVPATAFLDFAAEAEEYRLRLIACQKLLDRD